MRDRLFIVILSCNLIYPVLFWGVSEREFFENSQTILDDHVFP
jgi:hypothetical protein